FAVRGSGRLGCHAFAPRPRPRLSVTTARAAKAWHTTTRRRTRLEAGGPDRRGPLGQEGGLGGGGAFLPEVVAPQGRIPCAKRLAQGRPCGAGHGLLCPCARQPVNGPGTPAPLGSRGLPRGRCREPSGTPVPLGSRDLPTSRGEEHG